MKSVKKSLRQLLGKAYIDAIISTAIVLYDIKEEDAKALANEEIEFTPDSYIEKMDHLLEEIGKQIIPEVKLHEGAPTDSFKKASALKASPLGGFGYTRLGEDGKLYLASKSEHYHAPLGHNFPGYKLIDNARALGITNATHNNTRGYITRLLERELVRTVNGIQRDDDKKLDEVIESKDNLLNRVINLETGTLACEAGIKMMLARFYKLDDTFVDPKYNDRIPVFFVMSDHEGGKKANYHGTTIVAQTMRDLWPGLYKKLSDAEIYKVCPVKINDIQDFKEKIQLYNNGKYKVAGFIHEIILMNYGGIKLLPEYLTVAYELCKQNDIPIMCDEIQSCMWYKGMYLFRHYGLTPDFVVIGKGFPGGQYAASRIITTPSMDSLNQFGALVTNGQEELAALAYLITMEYAQENADYIEEMGCLYEESLQNLANEFPDFIDCVQGMGHLGTIFFKDADMTVRFSKILSNRCIDVSAQTYKANCPPAALTKPPIIATKEMILFLIVEMRKALLQIRGEM